MPLVHTNEEQQLLKEKWEDEKHLNEKINAKKKELESKRYELEKAESLNDFENADLCLGLWPQHGLKCPGGFVLHEEISSNGPAVRKSVAKSNEGIV